MKRVALMPGKGASGREAAGRGAGEPRPAVGQDELHERIQVCQSMVRSLAWQFLRRLPPNVEFDELVGEGQVGLMQAAWQFDPTRGAEFPTFAYWRIRGAMLDWARRQGWYDAFDYHSGRLAHGVGLDSDSAQQMVDPSSTDPAQQASEDELRELLRDLIGRLDGRARQILEATVLDDQTLEQAGRVAGVHKGTAQRAQVRGFEELAAALRERGLGELSGAELREYVMRSASARSQK